MIAKNKKKNCILDFFDFIISRFVINIIIIILSITLAKVEEKEFFFLNKACGVSSNLTDYNKYYKCKKTTTIFAIA